jgi:hypothetical protein
MLFPSLRTCEILCEERSMLPTCFDSKVQQWKVEEKNYGKQSWGKKKLHPFLPFLSFHMLRNHYHPTITIE